MSGKPVSFLSGPRIAVMIGDYTVAYAIGLNLSVSVSVTPITTLGRYDATGLEPVAYGLVRGSMTIVKLNAAGADNNLMPNESQTNHGTDLSSHLNPYNVILSQTFDLKVKVANVTANNTVGSFEYLTVRDCRLSSASGAVTVAAILNETVSFEGLIIVDDTTATEDIDTPTGTLS